MHHTSQSFGSRWSPAEIILAIMFLVAPFFYYDNIGGGGLNIPSNIAVWLSASTFIWMVVRQVLIQSTLSLPRHLLLVLAFPLLATISGFISGVSEPIDWMFRLLFVWGGTLFLLALFQLKFSRAHKDRLLFILLIAGLAHAIVACLQFFQPDDVTIFLPKSSGTNIATGIFQQINIHASFQATVVLTAWYLINRPMAQFNRVIKTSILLTTFLSVYIVMSSGSRVGFLSLLVGLGLFIPLSWSVIKRNKNNVFVITVVMLIATLTGVYSDGFGRLTDKSAEIHTEYKTSERIGIYLISAELIRQKPLLGHGLGSFDSVWQYQKADFQKRHPDYELIDDYVAHPHNEVLLWQVEGGILASLGILISFFALFVISWRSKARFMIPMLFPIALHNQVELPFHSSATSWFTCLTLIYLAISYSPVRKITYSITPPMTVTLKFVNHIAIIVSVLFFLHSIASNYQLKLATTSAGGNLSIPTLNPYFTKIAEDFRMQNLFMYSNHQQSKNGMEKFLEWQKQAIVNRPTYYNFKLLIAAYQALQQNLAACESATTASYMYPNNDEFRAYLESCDTVTKNDT